MKRNRQYNTIPIALLAGLFCLFGSSVASALTYEHTLNIPLSDLTISTDTIKGELRSRISVTEGSEYVNKDTLLLPMKNLRFKVPLLAENFRIKSWSVNSSSPMSMDYPPAKYLPEPPHHHYESESEKMDDDTYADFDPALISSDPDASISLGSQFRSALNSKLGYLMIMDHQRLPYHLLLTSGNRILNCRENLVVRGVNFRNPSVIPPSKYHDYTNPYMWIGAGSDINLQSMDKITSKGGIKIEDNGKLELSAKKQVSLEDDTVESGGILNITADETILGPGVTIEKGASLNINSR